MATTFIPMPKGIMDSINAIIQQESNQRKQNTRRQSLIKIANYILNKTQYNGVAFDDFLDISVKHLRANCGNHYLNDLKILEQAKIIEIDHSYFNFPKQNKTGRCKRYKFNADLVYTDLDIVQYDKTIQEQFGKDAIIKQTVSILRRLKLTLNKRELKKYVSQKITFETVLNERVQLNTALPEGKYFLKGQPIPQSKTKLLTLAQQRSKDLILYKNKCYIAHATTFIQKKVYELRHRYLNDLLRLKGINQIQNITCSRNNTNRRLDSNLTAIFSDAIPLLRLDNEALAQIDLSNSQFTILANLLERSLKQFQSGNLDLQTENESSFSDKKIKDVVVDFKYFNNSILMLLKKSTFTTTSKLVINDLNDFTLSNKTGIFYESYANLAWKDRYQAMAPGFTSFCALQEACRQKRPKPIAYQGGKLAHLFSQTTRQTNTKKEAQRKIEYQALQSKIKTIRADAKRTMFLTCFSSYRYQPESKRILKKHYPTLVSLLDNFKKNAIATYQELYDTDKERYAALPETKQGKKSPKDVGNASLAVLLQKIEAHIFIDNILAYCLQNKIPVLSKHDSILCRKSDYKLVKSIVDAFLSQFLGVQGYQLKISRP